MYTILNCAIRCSLLCLVRAICPNTTAEHMQGPQQDLNLVLAVCSPLKATENILPAAEAGPVVLLTALFQQQCGKWPSLGIIDCICFAQDMLQ